MTTRVLPFVAAIALGLAGVACGSSGSSTIHASTSKTSAAQASKSQTSTSAPRAGTRVLVSGYAFHPASIEVRAGTKLVFTNHDQTAHTATSMAGAFDTGAIAPGASRTVLLRRPGTYTYYCQFHAFMRATVVVR